MTVRDWNKDKRYLEELNEWERDSDDQDLYKIATHWHSEAEKWRVEAFRKYPTPEAYDAACAALRKHRERADHAENSLSQAFSTIKSKSEELTKAREEKRQAEERERILIAILHQLNFDPKLNTT